MKKIALFILLLNVLIISAQERTAEKNTLGFHGYHGPLTYGFLAGEISYQRELFKDNRLEADFGFDYNDQTNGTDQYTRYEFTIIDQWVWKLENGLAFFAGVGGGYSYFYDKTYPKYNNGTSKLSGDIGVEYNFQVPLQIALDIRPEHYFSAISDSYYMGIIGKIGLALRYRF